MNNKHRQTINDDLMGEYLVVFENIAKHFQFQADLNLRDMQPLPQYNYIRASLMNIQRNCVEQRQAITKD